MTASKEQREKWENGFGAWVNKGYQTFEIQEEYCHEIASCRDAYFHACEHQQQEIDRLKKQVEIAREVIEGSLFCDYRQKHSGQFNITSAHDYDCYKCSILEKLKEFEK